MSLRDWMPKCGGAVAPAAPPPRRYAAQRAALDAALEQTRAVIAGHPGLDPADPSPCSLANMLWLCDTARRDGAALPLDKSGRWLGFCQGVLVERGVIALPAPLLAEDPDDCDGGLDRVPTRLATAALLERCRAHLAGRPDWAALACERASAALLAAPTALPIAEASRLLGAVQGALCERGALAVDGERVFSRPLFHAAYRAEGQTPPPTRDRAQ